MSNSPTPIQDSRPRHPRLLVAIAGVSLLPAAANASVVHLNPGDRSLGGNPFRQGEFQYRVSDTAWDQAIFNAAGGTTAANRLSRNVADTDKLAGTPMLFTITHDPSTGFVYSLRNQNENTTTTLVWGTASIAGATAAASINGDAPTGAFNALRISASATEEKAGLEFSGLAFSSPTLTTQGALNPGLAGVAFNSDQNAVVTPAITQWVLSSVDLSAHRWQLSGTVTAYADDNNTVNAVNFSVTMLQGTISGPGVVPAPSAATLLAAALVSARRPRRKPSPR